MTVTGHLSELRHRLTWSALAFVALSVVSFIFIQQFVDIVLALSPEFDFVYLSPSELVTCYLKLALVLGLWYPLHKKQVDENIAKLKQKHANQD